jgi:hypothetical protein
LEDMRAVNNKNMSKNRGIGSEMKKGKERGV